MKKIILAAMAMMTIAGAANAEYLILKKLGQDPFVVAQIWGSYQVQREYSCRSTAHALTKLAQEEGSPGYYYCRSQVPFNAQNPTAPK